MSQQHSRFCLSFDHHHHQQNPHYHLSQNQAHLSSPSTSAFVHRTLPPESPTLTFSVEYWQPFIDQRDFKTPFQNSSTICGPLLSLLVELAKQLESSLAFIPDLSDEILPFPELENGSVHFVLTPFAPMSLEDQRVSRLVRFSEPLGDIPMISILSGREPLTMDFEAAKLFNYAFFYLYFISFLVVNLSVMVIVPWRIYRRLAFLPNSVRILLKQPLRKKKRKRRKSSNLNFPKLPHLLLLPHLFLLTGLFHLIFSTKLLAFFTFSLPYRKVDNLAELLAEQSMTIILFKGETSVEILLPEKEEEEKYFFDKSRVSIVNPSNDVAGEWERSVAGQIADRSEALISDAYYLDYVFNSHVHRFPRLYRGSENSLVLPYFLPLSARNPNELNDALNRLIINLRESGIYEFWLREVREDNGHLKHGSGDRRRANSLDYDLLTLRDCRLLFYLLSGLLSVSVAIFALEEVIGRREKKKDKVQHLLYGK